MQQALVEARQVILQAAAQSGSCVHQPPCTGTTSAGLWMPWQPSTAVAGRGELLSKLYRPISWLLSAQAFQAAQLHAGAALSQNQL